MGRFRAPPITPVGVELSLDSAGCYTFQASRGGFWSACAFAPRSDASRFDTHHSFRQTTGCRVQNSVAAGRRLARRATVHQVVAVVAAALACLALGIESTLAVALGGGAVTLGAALSATWSLRPEVVPSGVALARMVGGVVLKWCVVFLLFSAGLLLWRLPALPLLAGVLIALAAQFVAVVRR